MAPGCQVPSPKHSQVSCSQGFKGWAATKLPPLEDLLGDCASHSGELPRSETSSVEKWEKIPVAKTLKTLACLIFMFLPYKSWVNFISCIYRHPSLRESPWNLDIRRKCVTFKRSELCSPTSVGMETTKEIGRSTGGSIQRFDMMWMEAYHQLELPNQAAFASSPLPSGIASGSPLSSWNLLTWLFWVEQGPNLTEFLFESLKQDSGQASCFSIRIYITQNQTEHWNSSVGTMVLECSQHMVLPLHQWSVGPARDQRCVLPKKTSAKMNMTAINSNHTQIPLATKTYIYKSKNQSWNCFKNVDSQQMLCFTTKSSLFYLSNFQPPRPAHGKHGNSIQQTLQPPHWQHHLSPVESPHELGYVKTQLKRTRRPAWFSSPCPGKEAKNLLEIVWDDLRFPPFDAL